MSEEEYKGWTKEKVRDELLKLEHICEELGEDSIGYDIYELRMEHGLETSEEAKK